jgi:hypothetical protein
MPRYTTFDYNSGAYYGTSATSTLSIAPFYGIAINYDNIFLSWKQPATDISRLRVVRNHDNFSESQEDGIIVYDELSVSPEQQQYKLDGAAPIGEVSRFVYLNTGVQEAAYFPGVQALPSGKNIYYTIWVLSLNEAAVPVLVWTNVGSLEILLATDHATILSNTDDTAESPDPNRTRTRSTHEKFLDLLPRTFTSETQSPLDEIKQDSDLYKFLGGLSYTLDELMTLADFLLPDYTAANFSTSILDAKAYDLGLTQDNRASTKYQRQLVREARSIYGAKGTPRSISTLIETMTGFDVSLTPSPNLMTSNQDSTFRRGVGLWKTYNGCAVYARNFFAPVPIATEANTIDLRYTGQVAIKTAGAWMSNGVARPVTEGIKVSPNTEYTFSYYQQRNTGAPTVSSTPSIFWFDIYGNKIRQVTGSNYSVTTSWAKQSVTATAPPAATENVTQFQISSGTATVTMASTSAFSTGDPVLISIPQSGVYGGFSESVTVTVATGTTLTFTTTDDNVTVGTGAATVGNASREAAAFAGIQLTFDSIVTGSVSYDAAVAQTGYPDYYVLLDSMQFAVSSVTSFNEARGITATLAPSKTNYILNPSFETNTTGWATTAGTLTRESRFPPGLAAGSKCLQVATSASSVVSTTTNAGTSIAGRHYTLSVYLRANADTPTVTVSLTPINNGTLGDAASISAVLSTSWQRFEVTTFVPLSYTNISFKASVTTSVQIDIDAVQVEQAYVARDYFDGSMTETGASFASNGESILFYNKAERLSRLFVEITKYLPNNTPYIVRSSTGIETVQGSRFANFSS